MEILSDVLRAVRLTGALFFDVELTTPGPPGARRWPRSPGR
jgi:hypothetical protein